MLKYNGPDPGGIRAEEITFETGQSENTPSGIAVQESCSLGELAESIAIRAGMQSVAFHARAGNHAEAASLMAALGRFSWSLRGAA